MPLLIKKNNLGTLDLSNFRLIFKLSVSFKTFGQNVILQLKLLSGIDSILEGSSGFKTLHRTLQNVLVIFY